MGRVEQLLAVLADQWRGKGDDPIPRPWDGKGKRIGATTLSQDRVRAALRARGYDA